MSESAAPQSRLLDETEGADRATNARQLDINVELRTPPLLRVAAINNLGHQFGDVCCRPRDYALGDAKSSLQQAACQIACRGFDISMTHLKRLYKLRLQA